MSARGNEVRYCLCRLAGENFFDELVQDEPAIASALDNGRNLVIRRRPVAIGQQDFRCVLTKNRSVRTLVPARRSPYDSPVTLHDRSRLRRKHVTCLLVFYISVRKIDFCGKTTKSQCR